MDLSKANILPPQSRGANAPALNGKQMIWNKKIRNAGWAIQAAHRSLRDPAQEHLQFANEILLATFELAAMRWIHETMIGKKVQAEGKTEG